MNCSDIQKLIPDYLAGALGADEANRVRVHIETCPACRAEAEAHRRAWEMAAGISDIKPAPGFTAAVRKRLEKRPRISAQKTKRRLVGVRYALAAAACLLVAFGVFLFLQPEGGNGDGLSAEEETEIIRNLEFFVTMDELKDGNLKADDIDIIKDEDYPKREALAESDIDPEQFALADNGTNGGAE